MKIVIQPSGLACLNVGDQAMLETAYGRLRALWPQAQIHVLTTAPDAVRRTLPGALPFSPEGRSDCLDLRLFGRFSKPRYPLSGMFSRLEDSAFRYAPMVQALSARTKLRLRGRKAAAKLVDRVQSVDLYVFSGAGMITDAFAYDAIDSLELLHLAKRFGARTAILGNMFGPVSNSDLKAVCRRILPAVDLISVRERVTSLPLLADCGVDPANVRVTGDETLEFILANRVPAPDRNALGVNARIAYYSGLTPSSASALSAVIGKLSRQFGAPLEPLAVAHDELDDDRLALRLLDSRLNLGLAASRPQTPLSLVQRIACCRLVITGSYHAAVFALAQGIPAIGLAFAPYYDAKFKGLQDLFGNGCRCIDGTKPGWDEELQATASDLWMHAGRWESELLESAQRQSAMSRAAYRELQQIVDDNRQTAAETASETLPLRAPEGA
jgi:polysaccharide pyruvyl transferase WcaK-like protein